VKLAVCAVLVALSAAEAEAKSTTARIATFVNQACKELGNEGLTDETRVAHVGTLQRQVLITEHVHKPIPRYYFQTPLLVGWETFLEPGQISVGIPESVIVTLRDLERQMGRATEQEDDIHARLNALDPNKPVLRTQAGVSMPPPQRVYEYRNMGRRGLCTATLYVEGHDESENPRRYRLTRIEILD
jgi:hypothetical protein